MYIWYCTPRFRQHVLVPTQGRSLLGTHHLVRDVWVNGSTPFAWIEGLLDSTQYRWETLKVGLRSYSSHHPGSEIPPTSRTEQQAVGASHPTTGLMCWILPEPVGTVANTLRVSNTLKSSAFLTHISTNNTSPMQQEQKASKKVKGYSTLFLKGEQ